MWTPICHLGSRSLPSKNRRRSTCVAGRILINEIKLRCASSLGSDGPAPVECVTRSGQTTDVGLPWVANQRFNRSHGRCRHRTNAELRGPVNRNVRRTIMDRYIEVIGEGSFNETASRFIAEVTLEVRAAKDETALRDVAEFCNDAVAILRDAGLADEELTEGGTDFRRPWYWKKQVGQNASRKLILKVSDFGRLVRALELLERLQSRNKERKTISVDMRQPEFADSVDAKAKATQLVSSMNCRLGMPLQVEEGTHAKRNSGFSGDEDWGGDYSRFAMGGGVVLAAAAGAASQPDPDLQHPTRTIFVKCRVRFAIEDA